MNNDNIRCLCGKEFDEKNFAFHCKYCKLFLKKFTNFDFIIARLLEEYLYNKDNFIIIQFMLKRYLKLIRKKIKKYKDHNKISNFNNSNLIVNKQPVIHENELALNEGLFKDCINIDYSTPNPDRNYSKKENLKNNNIIGNNKNENIIYYYNFDYNTTPNPDINIEKIGVMNNNINDENNKNGNIIETPNPDINIEKNGVLKNDTYKENNKDEISKNKNNNNNIFDNFIDWGKNIPSLLLNSKSKNSQELLYYNN